jgi:hypothetical protein
MTKRSEGGWEGKPIESPIRIAFRPVGEGLFEVVAVDEHGSERPVHLELVAAAVKPLADAVDERPLYRIRVEGEVLSQRSILTDEDTEQMVAELRRRLEGAEALVEELQAALHASSSQPPT